MNLPDDGDEEDDVEEDDGGGRSRVSAHPDPLDPPGPVRGVTWEVSDHVSPPPLTVFLPVTEPRYVCASTALSTLQLQYYNQFDLIQ